MAKWLTETAIYVGDIYGNAVELRVGVVQIGRRTVFGFRRADATDDRPTYTLDTLALSDMVKACREGRTELIKRSGGL